nr:MAG TPA: hypothetical protein [Caudoviricetes sp.]
MLLKVVIKHKLSPHFRAKCQNSYLLIFSLEL